MGRPASGLDEYLDWQERLESYKASGLSVDEFCLSEGIAKSTYYRWLERLKDGLPEEMVEEGESRSASSPAVRCSCRSLSKPLRWKSNCPTAVWCGCHWGSAKWSS